MALALVELTPHDRELFSLAVSSVAAQPKKLWMSPVSPAAYGALAPIS